MKSLKLLSIGLAALTLAARCGGTMHESASGDVADSSLVRPDDYKLTSDTYNKWVRAQWALDTVQLGDIPRLDARHATQAGVDSVVQSLEVNPHARGAIEDADLSVRDFVLTTVALAQSWDAHGADSARSPTIAQNVAFLTKRATRDSTARVPPHVPFLRDAGDARDVSEHNRSEDDSGEEWDGDRGEGHGHGRGHWKHGKGRGHHGRKDD